ncbi:ribonuclease R [Xanthocytophaga flava]|uniref:ribonuclease R n=1 Tax=Xanthocytophaga flava TaxID=3048013 RepID=UPI0028D06A61|nr:ribonuclease R [Xanthocytophaga flavus]MDJ1468754.1 ribonuclease R [Xanthocytophaga flavus]
MRTKKETKKSAGKDRAINLKEQILSVLRQNRSQAFTAKQLAKKLQLKGDRYEKSLRDMLDFLIETDEISMLSNGTYRYNTKTQTKTGVVDWVSPHYAFIVVGNDEKDIWVHSSNLNGALDGDTVNVVVYMHRAGSKPEGEVSEILQRKKDEYVGIIEITKRHAFVIPDNRKMYADIYIPLDSIGNAKDREKVLVKITHWGDAEQGPQGKVTEVLGKAGEHETEMHSIMAEFGLPFRFSEEVEAEAKAIRNDIESEVAKRRDFRDIVTFTIDPEDAKDFDDALSIRKLENGHWEIGVHIADVTHYVTPGTSLEREAFARATSVYLVDRTIPMLPERLSNDLCSLRPNEDKLTFSSVFEMDETGKIYNEWFGRTIIHSNRRFTYEEVQRILEGESGDFAEDLRLLNDIAKQMKEDRFKNGAMSFETIEVKFKLDEKGVPLAVYPKIRKDAHKLIEEFMLLANKKVAEWVYKYKKGKEKNTMVYRIHESPDNEKVKLFASFIRRFGYKIQTESGKIADSMNQLIEDLEGKPEQFTLQNLAIRTMAKARYSTEPLGHFGLAFAHYTHFTSPIRRYPDMMAHRLLQLYLNAGKAPDRNVYEDQCKHSSEREKVASDAERASIKYKQVEFMKNAEQKDYEGLVTGVTEFGVFVEMIETRCEGMVRISDLTDDYYEHDPENYRIIGRKTKRIITFGDKVTVRVKATNLERRSIDLTLVNFPDGKPLQEPSKDKRRDSSKSRGGKKKGSSSKYF